MNVYALVGCGKKKKPGELTAREKYASNYFQKKAAWAEENADEWWILSAKYGALDPDQVIDDYDVRIGDLDRDGRAAFYRSVWQEIFPPPGDWFGGQLVVLAGQDYIDALGSIPNPAPWENYEVILPFDGTDGIGEQLAWLTDELEESKELDGVEKETAQTKQTSLISDGGRRYGRRIATENQPEGPA